MNTIDKKRIAVFDAEAAVKAEPTADNYISLYKADAIYNAALNPTGFDGVNFLAGNHVSDILEMSGGELHKAMQNYMAEQGRRVFEELQP